MSGRIEGVDDCYVIKCSSALRDRGMRGAGQKGEKDKKDKKKRTREAHMRWQLVPGILAN